MTLRRRLAAAAALLALAPATAHAQGTQGTPTSAGTLTGDGHLVVGISETLPGEPGTTPVVGYITYTTTTDNHPAPGDISGLCAVDVQHGKFGWSYRIIGTTLDGRVVIDHLVCVPFDANGNAQPPRLPQLPTIQDAWNAADVPAPLIVTDPPARGITGLPTHISARSATTVTIDATVRGYRVEGTATLDHFAVSVDGAPPRATNHDDVTFTTKGDHTIVVAATWRGRATLTGPDLDAPIRVDDIGVATIGTTRHYPVHEIRSVLQP